jgi:threonine synthase
VPSGNYGNLTAGLIANEMGLPVDHFLAASNANKIVPEYLDSGVFEAKLSIKTISNAMDVGDPSNFARMNDLFNGKHGAFLAKLTGYSYSDEATRQALRKLYQEKDYIADPHGAIGYLALREYMDEHDVLGVFLETAHPVKFREAVEPVIGEQIPLPEALEDTMQKSVRASYSSPQYTDFRVLLSKLLS